MVTGDPRFASEIRGRAALKTWLQRLFPADSVEVAAGRAKLTASQQLQLKWDIRCALCGSRPEGPVRRDGTIVIEFRCPTRECG